MRPEFFSYWLGIIFLSRQLARAFIESFMLSLISPSKINLFLRIVKKRPDKYHELASLFQAIDLCDTIHFKLSNSDCLSCTDPTVPTDHSNLILKAADLFRRKTGITTGLSIHLEKLIPMQAGLGGGSSNAATTLWAFNQLCGNPASLAELSAWSGEIGSDITFFLSHGTAYCTGRGEILQPIAPLTKTALTIVKPSFGLSTPLVYSQLDAPNLPQRDPHIILKSFLDGQPLYFNDLETPAFKIMPELANLKSYLQSLGYSDVLMSGSGSAFFCLGTGTTPSLPDLSIHRAHFLNRSPNQWYRI